MWTSANIFRYSWGKLSASPLYILSRYLWAFVAFSVLSYFCFLAYVLGGGTRSFELASLFLLLFLLVQLGLHVFILAFVKSGSLRSVDCFFVLKLYPSYLAAWLLFTLAVCIGTLFFIAPGVYLYLRLQFFPHALIEQGTSFWQSLQTSWKTTENQVKELFRLQVYSMGVLLLGVLCLGIGILGAFALIAIGKAFLWRKLTESRSFFHWFR
jgi:hypothetical protein